MAWNHDRHFKHPEAQRFSMAIQIQRVIDPPIQHVVEHQIHGV
ncbi:hypothetical protein CTATCC11996_08635 [Comamonas testosteroni ATCC 11996]|nr:hypothetical protein CTATCC11996_08635 [Comamonas testosteroni ATCC 11996]